MHTSAKIYVAGHRGLVGSALLRQLGAMGYTNMVTRSHAELDLADSLATRQFFEQERPDYVLLAAAKVGGIHANNAYPAEFIHENLAIQTNVIHQSFLSGVKRLLFLGSSCIYPGNCQQPIREEYLLSGPLEATNRPYALAKIAGIEMCWSYNRQYGTKFLAVMPSNLYGPGDNYHPQNSHVIPALIRKFHEAREIAAPFVTVWGSGAPRREFLYSDDMAKACLFLMELDDAGFDPLLGSDRNDGVAPLVNIGTGTDLTIGELAGIIRDVVGYEGGIVYDSSKPDGTARKLMSIDRLHAIGWQAETELRQGLEAAYRDFVDNHAGHQSGSVV